ncbi:MAG TPA: DEAD/DEAH box helicase [Armatimonadota bacterium]
MITGANEPRPDLPTDGADSPATLLFLPPAVRTSDQPGHLLAYTSPPLARSLRHWYDTDAPQHQVGYVKLWPAQAVDLQRLLNPPPPFTTENETGKGKPGDQAGISEAVSLRRARREALARRLFVTLQPPPESLLRMHGALSWPGPFFPYQLTGIRALLHAEQLLLGDEMGLGKTIQVIAALRILLYRRELERALIVAPASLLAQWQQEIARWAPDLRVLTLHGSAEERRRLWAYRAHITLTTYETLREDCAGHAARGPRAEEWGVIVLDEAQRIKSRVSELARICKRLPRQRAWALTGTPMENRPDDTASILEFVTGRPVPADGPLLRALLNQHLLRRKKTDVLRDLPPKIVIDLPLTMPPAQRRAYERAEQEGIIALRGHGDVRIEHILALITHLKRLCNFSPEGVSAKLDDVRRRLDELVADGHRALIFTQYTGDESGARRIAAGLQRFKPLVFTGELSLDARRALIEQFRHGDHQVLILSLRAGGQGLNLQQASYVFHFDRWWNPAVEQQAEDRTHRIGQTRPVHVYRYLMADTIEQRIDDLLRRKMDQCADLIDGASPELSRLLTKDDFPTLFGLDEQAP